MKKSLAYIIVLTFAAGWCLGIMIPALLTSIMGADTPAARGSYSVFSPICHQWDSHSLHLVGYKLGVCARCSAIYFGFLIGVVLQPVCAGMKIGRSATWIVIGCLPMVIDVVCDFTGLHQSSILTRLVTGGFFGILAAVVLLPSVFDAIRDLAHIPSPPEGTLYESQTR